MKLNDIIKKKTARVGVIGLGYVGLPLAMEFTKSGFKVFGLDISEEKVSSINSGVNYIQDINDDELKEAVNNNKLSASSDFSLVKDLDTISICVPTPLKNEKNPDVSYIISVMKRIEPFLHKEMIIILESTTYPGCTKELIQPVIENNNFTIGKDIYLCFSPERIDPGNKDYSTHNTPKILGGVTQNCSLIGQNLYESIIQKVVVVSSTETAEMVKLLENTFRSINIGLANEVAIMCEKLGVNAWEVIDAAATKPFGFMKFTPGPGLGGHCIPIDPHYLSWKLKTLDYDARFIQLAGEINSSMPSHIVAITSKALNKDRKSINGSSLLIVGVAYKKDINDYRESPSIDIIELLLESGAKVEFHDPFVNEVKLKNNILKNTKTLNQKNLSCFDAIIIATDHSNVDYKMLLKHSKQIIDTRNIYNKIDSEKIVTLGKGKIVLN